VGQTIRDPLTTAFSRRSGIEMLELQLVNAERNQLPLAIAFIDLDHFKASTMCLGMPQATRP
jgi:diguanylate cyclase (GGDEF)-like protein